MLKVFKYTLIDLARNRFVLGYAVLMLLVAQGLFMVEDDPSKALLSLVQVVMALVPLIALVFTIVYSYDTLEFTQLLAVQPIARRSILGGQLMALAVALLIAQGFGLGLPLLANEPSKAALMLSLSGSGLVLVFTALGVLIALKQREKARGVGLGLAIWFLFVLVYDALLMSLMFAMSDYPIEPFVVPLAALNPIDMGRILVMLQVDLAAMMGYSGAVYKEFFGSAGGIGVAFGVMMIWVVIPTLFSFHTFQRKDL